MTIKKNLIALAAAAALALPTAARAEGAAGNYDIRPNPIMILVGLLIPAINTPRDAGGRR
jgi:hypothetical protein